MFCGKANRSLEKDYASLVKRLMEAGFLEKEIQISSDKEAEDLLSRLDKEFRKCPDLRNKRKQAVLIWAFREYIGKEVTF